jgi:hypothetical protein
LKEIVKERKKNIIIIKIKKKKKFKQIELIAKIKLMWFFHP